MQLTDAPLAAFVEVELDWANALLELWGHYLGACRRPFGRQAFALLSGGVPVGVAVSASTVSKSLGQGKYARREVVELARLCSAPGCNGWTRVTLRLWRELAPIRWADKYWPVRACVAYSDAARHRGNIYRCDGWRRVGTNPGSGGGGTWTGRRVARSPKTLWVFEVAMAGSDSL